jgi:hypothetical protein
MTTKERTKKLACAFNSLKCSSRAVDDEPSLNQSRREPKQEPMPKDVSAVWNAAVAKRNVGARNVMKSSPTHSTESNASETTSVNEGLWMPMMVSGVEQAYGNRGRLDHCFGPVFDVLEHSPAESPSGKSLVLYPQQQLQKSQKEEKQQISSIPSGDIILPTIRPESSIAKLRPEGSKPMVERPALVALCPCLAIDMKDKPSSCTEEGMENREGTNKNSPLHNISTNGENTLEMSNRDVLYHSPSASWTKESRDVLLLEAQMQQEPTFQNREAFKMVQSSVDPIDAPPPPPPLRPPRLNDFAQEIKVSEQDDHSPTEKKKSQAYLNALKLVPNDAALTFGIRDHVEIHRSATKMTIVTPLTPRMFPGWPSAKAGTDSSTDTESSFSSISSFADVAEMQQSSRWTSQSSPVVNRQVVHKPRSFFWRTHPKATVRSDDPQRPHRRTMREVVPKLLLVATGDSESFDHLFLTEPDNRFDLQDGTNSIAVYEPYLRPSIVREMWMDSKSPRPRATLGR